MTNKAIMTCKEKSGLVEISYTLLTINLTVLFQSLLKVQANGPGFLNTFMTEVPMI